MTVETYVAVPWARVPVDVQYAASIVHAACVKVLQLPGPVQLRWFTVATYFDEEAARAGHSDWPVFESDERVAGYVERGNLHETCVRIGRPLRATLITTAHDARHLWQFQQSDWPRDPDARAWWPLRREAEEADAATWAELAVTALYPTLSND